MRRGNWDQGTVPDGSVGGVAQVAATNSSLDKPEVRGIISPVPCSLFPVPCSLFPVPCSLFYSYLSASIGSRLAARMAGIMPLTKPVMARIPVATITEIGEMISRISALSAFFARAL